VIDHYEHSLAHQHAFFGDMLLRPILQAPVPEPPVWRRPQTTDGGCFFPLHRGRSGNVRVGTDASVASLAIC